MIEKIKDAAQFVKNKYPERPIIGLVLGSGLGQFVNELKNSTIIPYLDIPHFKNTSVEGHQGIMALGQIEGIDVVILQGRLHAYEGHSMEDVVFSIRVLALLGIESLLLTNAAGGINTKFKVGDLVIINDHINNMGKNPLIGPNILELGPRFPDMTEAYSNELKLILKKTAKKCRLKPKSGVYVGVLGPTYETPAEIRMFRKMGADMVGMSTVPESIAANHLGLKVAGISCITNMAAGISGVKLNHEEVKKEAVKVMQSFTKWLQLAIKEIGANHG